jgi:hypothetical protein
MLANAVTGARYREVLTVALRRRIDCTVNEERIDVLHKPHCLSSTKFPHVGEIRLETFAGGFVRPAIFSQDYDRIAAVYEFVWSASEPVPL